MDPDLHTSLRSESELALAQWQQLAEQARQRVMDLEMALHHERESHLAALGRLEQQGTALASELVRAEAAEEEVHRLTAWVEYHLDLGPAYEASLERISDLEGQQQRSQDVLAGDSQLISHLRQEISELRHELNRARDAAAAAVAPPETDDESLKRLAFQDPVTGLPNFHHGMRYLHLQLGNAAEVEGIVALARIDIHRLRELNLYLGTRVSDQILRQFAARFKGVLIPEAMLSRGRDDEFWLVISCTSGGPLGLRKVTEQITQIIQRLMVALTRPFEVGDHSAHLAIACGIACSQDQEEAGQLLECAALALEASKQAEPAGKLVFYEATMQEPIRTRLSRVPLLRQAVQREEFELYFQPIVQLDTLQIQGVESLLRWNHPSEGRLLPAQFIEAALESGAIVAIGEWVARQVCQFSQQSHPYLWSMNLSAQELVQANFMRRFARAVEAAQLAHPEFLVVEISESGLASQSLRLTSALKQLRQWGVQLAIDNFSFDSLSLRRLEDLDVSYLKLSQEVTHSLETPLYRNLVRGAVLAADDLGCKIVAEGVEKMEQLDCLKELGCHWGQGHLLQPPANIGEIWSLLALDDADSDAEPEPTE